MTARLCSFVVHQWPDVDGVIRLEAGGLDLLSVPFDRLLNIIWTLLLRNKDEKERAKTERELLRPLPGEQVRSEDPQWGADAQGAQFLAAMERGTPKAPQPDDEKV